MNSSDRQPIIFFRTMVLDRELNGPSWVVSATILASIAFAKDDAALDSGLIEIVVAYCTAFLAIAIPLSITTMRRYSVATTNSLLVERFREDSGINSLAAFLFTCIVLACGTSLLDGADPEISIIARLSAAALVSVFCMTAIASWTFLSEMLRYNSQSAIDMSAEIAFDSRAIIERWARGIQQERSVLDEDVVAFSSNLQAVGDLLDQSIRSQGNEDQIVSVIRFFEEAFSELLALGTSNQIRDNRTIYIGGGAPDNEFISRDMIESILASDYFPTARSILNQLLRALIASIESNSSYLQLHVAHHLNEILVRLVDYPDSGPLLSSIFVDYKKSISAAMDLGRNDVVLELGSRWYREILAGSNQIAVEINELNRHFFGLNSFIFRNGDHSVAIETFQNFDIHPTPLQAYFNPGGSSSEISLWELFFTLNQTDGVDFADDARRALCQLWLEIGTHKAYANFIDFVLWLYKGMMQLFGEEFDQQSRSEIATQYIEYLQALTIEHHQRNARVSLIDLAAYLLYLDRVAELEQIWGLHQPESASIARAGNDVLPDDLREFVVLLASSGLLSNTNTFMMFDHNTDGRKWIQAIVVLLYHRAAISSRNVPPKSVLKDFSIQQLKYLRRVLLDIGESWTEFLLEYRHSAYEALFSAKYDLSSRQRSEDIRLELVREIEARTSNQSPD